MEALNRWIIENWKELCLGMILTIIATRYEFIARGKFEIGGEWCITPVMIMTGMAVRKIRAGTRKLKRNRRFMIAQKRRITDRRA